MDAHNGNELATGRGKHDIVGNLPLELVAQVTEYLDIVDIVRCHRVSRQWRLIFSSDTIINGILSQTVALLELDTKNISTADAMTYFRWFHGVQSAHPVKKAFLPLPGALETLKHVVYHSRRICAVHDRQTVAMLDLGTGKITFLPNITTGHPVDLFLSDRWLIIESDDRGRKAFVAWDIHTSQKVAEWRVSFRESSYPTITKDKVIIAPVSSLDSCPIRVWDLLSDQVDVFGSFLNLCLWHADADENVLITFEFNWDTDPPEVQQTKWTLTSGELLHQKKFCLSMGGRSINKFGVCRLGDKVRTYGRKSVAHLRTVQDPYTTMHLMYNYANDQLSLRWLCSPDPINELTLYGGAAFLGPYVTYLWAHQLRGVAIYNAFNGSITSRPYQLHNRELSVRDSLGADLMPPSRPMRWAEFRDPSLECIGDQEVCGVFSNDGVQLWFFNPDFVPDIPDAEPFLVLEESG